MLFWIANICVNIIWDPTSGIRAKLERKRWLEKKARVQEFRNLMAGEEGKGSGIEKFDGRLHVFEDAD